MQKISFDAIWYLTNLSPMFKKKQGHMYYFDVKLVFFQVNLSYLNWIVCTCVVVRSEAIVVAQTIQLVVLVQYTLAAKVALPLALHLTRSVALLVRLAFILADVGLECASFSILVCLFVCSYKLKRKWQQKLLQNGTPTAFSFLFDLVFEYDFLFEFDSNNSNKSWFNF